MGLVPTARKWCSCDWKGSCRLWLLADISGVRDLGCMGAVFCELWLISGVAGATQVFKKLRQQAALKLEAQTQHAKCPSCRCFCVSAVSRQL
jgi:hypothetical protein